MSTPLMDSYLNESTKLDKENYINWKFKLQTLMKGTIRSITYGDKPKIIASVALVQDWDRRETEVKVLLRMSVKEKFPI